MKYLPPRLFAWLLVAVVYLVSMFHYNAWHKQAMYNGGDQFGYYVYLPATFLYHDLGTFDKTVHAVREKGYYPPNGVNGLGVTELSQTPTGKYSGKYTMGVAIMQAPFFLVAHALALATGCEADGFSPIYLFFNCLSAVVYSLLGLWLLMRVLARFFNDKIVAITLLTVALATNLYFMQVSAGAMAHPFLFFLYAVVLYYSVSFCEKQSLVAIIAICVSLGMVALIRPTEAVLGIVPLIWVIGTLGPKKIGLVLSEHPSWVVVGIACLILPIVPQLLFWKWVSGNWVYYSYSNEGFDFRHPHILSGLTSGQNGWLFYTPVMVLALIGMPLLLWKNKPMFFALSAFLGAHLFFTYSWWCWQYINGFGSRPMVETYPLLALPLAYIVQWASKRVFTLVPLLTVLLFCIWLNMFQTYQQRIGILWTEAASRTYVLHMIGKTQPSAENLIEFDTDEPQPDTNSLTYKSTLFADDMEHEKDTTYLDTVAYSGRYAYKFTAAQHYGLNVLATGAEGHFNAGDWIKVSMQCRYDECDYQLYNQSQVAVEFLKPNAEKPIKSSYMYLQNKVNNPEHSIWHYTPHQWGLVYCFVKIPKRFKPQDSLKFFVSNAGLPILLDDVKVEVWTEKRP